MTDLSSEVPREVPGDVQVRVGRPDDLIAVVKLEVRCFSDPWPPAALLGELTPDELRLPFVLEIDGELRGYLMGWLVVDQLHILNFAIDPDFQRRGLAARLLREAAERGVALGMEEFTLEVRQSNIPALGFYKKHGFRETGVRRGYYVDNGEDAIIMACALGPILAQE
jgi:ribosomal-protein-alanine N-acetyltransferase